MLNTARPSDGSQYLQSVYYTSSVLMWIFIFEKWVNADSQFLTFVVTVLGFLPGTMYRLLVANFDWNFLIFYSLTGKTSKLP